MHINGPCQAPAPVNPLELADAALTWLRGCQIRESGYDQGGIRDPLDGGVPGEHYAATHFAWCCALRHAARPDPALREAALAAIAFHIRTAKDEYAPGTWDYHWDFNNLASIETYFLLQRETASPPDQHWISSILAWKTNSHFAVNWVAMRALAHFKRYALLGRGHDRKAARGWLRFVLEAQKTDGGIEDVKGRCLPSQYHAYTACLLHRMLPQHEAVPWAVRNAARWLLAIVGPDGEMNAVGRGQGQIFGYACAVYLLRAAAHHNPDLAARCRWGSAKILERLARFQSPDGWWPLVLNDLPLERRAGWYDYHHLTVYNAFAAVWLTLAAAIPVPPGPIEPPPPGIIHLGDSALLAVRRKRWFVLFGAGREGAQYATEPGITPYQVHWEGHDLFRHPLGPGTGKYGELTKARDQETHCWAPLWRGEDAAWHAPAGAEGRLEHVRGSKRWRLGLVRDGTSWQRELVPGRRFLEARDTLCLDESGTASRPAAIWSHNFAWPADSPCEIGPAYARDGASGAILRTWGGGPLYEAGTVESAWGQARILAATGDGPRTRSGWRLRQGPAAAGGRLPGIVCLSWDPWTRLWKRKQRLLFELARTGRSPRTLYIEPCLSLTHIIEDAGGLLKPRGGRYRRCLGGRPADLGHGFHLASPLWPWPGRRTFPALNRANHRAWLAQLRRFVKAVGFPEGYILWLYHPSQTEALEALGDDAELIVYDWTDDWVLALPDGHNAAAHDSLEARQRELLCRADVVFAVSRILEQRARDFCPTVRYLPNATDPAVFRPRDPSVPDHPLAARRPLLLYLSQITERLDTGLLRRIALARPDWTVVLAGPLACPPETLAPLDGLPNVVLAGPLPYEEAAQLAAQADVCLLPHKEEALTMSLDPIKLYDYLATGRPIVTTAVAMHQDLARLVRVASGPEAFVAAIAAALAESPGLAENRLQKARHHTWEGRAREAADLLERFFPEE